MWQHTKLSEQISPQDTLACCWDVKQPTNNNNNKSSVDRVRVHMYGYCQLHDALMWDMWPEPIPLRDKIYGNLEELRRTATSIIIIIIINLIYVAQFDANGILTALYIVITYIQMQYVHV